jgi:hypothetical protein
MRPVRLGRDNVAAALLEIERASQEERFVDIADAYTITAYTPSRTLDATTATATQVAHFLATLIQDLKAGQVKRD